MRTRRWCVRVGMARDRPVQRRPCCLTTATNTHAETLHDTTDINGQPTKFGEWSTYPMSHYSAWAPEG